MGYVNVNTQRDEMKCKSRNVDIVEMWIIMDVYFNVGKRRNNVVSMNIRKKIKIKPPVKNKTIFLSFKEHTTLKIFYISFPILRGIWKWLFADPQKFLKHPIYWLTKTIFKPSYFAHSVKCQRVFNCTRKKVQGHYAYCTFNFIFIS